MATFKNKVVYAIEKLFYGRIMHKGFQLPVAVYQVEQTKNVFYHHCVCFENTRFERQIDIAMNETGTWYDMEDRDDSLAVLIGQMIETQTTTLEYAILA